MSPVLVSWPVARDVFLASVIVAVLVGCQCYWHDWNPFLGALISLAVTIAVLSIATDGFDEDLMRDEPPSREDDEQNSIR
jgi:hypothetical protein